MLLSCSLLFAGWSVAMLLAAGKTAEGRLTRLVAPWRGLADLRILLEVEQSLALSTLTFKGFVGFFSYVCVLRRTSK